MKATPIAPVAGRLPDPPLCAAGLDARLTLVEGGTDDVRVNLTPTNTGTSRCGLLNGSCLAARMPPFQVERDGQPVGYEGP